MVDSLEGLIAKKAAAKLGWIKTGQHMTIVVPTAEEMDFWWDTFVSHDTQFGAQDEGDKLILSPLGFFMRLVYNRE